MKLSNFSTKTGINHAKVKRWAREFLGAIPFGQHRGYAREIDIFEAWKLYVAALLLQDLRFSIQETREVLKLLPSKKDNLTTMHFSEKYPGEIDVSIDLRKLYERFRGQLNIEGG